MSRFLFPDDNAALRRRLLVIVIIAALSVVAYANATRNGFVYDDNVIVAYNPLVKSLRHLPKIFTTGYWGAENTDSGLYRPLTVATYCVDYAVWGRNAFAFHVVNIFLHAGVSVLCYLTVLGILGRSRVAALAGLLFAAHPIHVEAVTGIVGRAEILAAGFALLALNSHLRFRTTGRKAFLLGAVLLYLAALLSKESSVLYPVLALAVEAAMRSPRLSVLRDFRSVSWWSPYLLYAVTVLIVFVIRVLALGGHQAGGPAVVSIMDNPLYELPAAQRMVSALFILAKYLSLLAFPLRLSADYSYNQIPSILGLLDWRVLIALACFLAFLWVALFSFRRHDGIFLGVVLLLVPLLPVSNLIVPIGTIMAERLLYLPALGFCVLMAVAIERTMRFRRLGKVMVAVTAMLLAAYVGRTVIRNGDWRDDATLFAAALNTAPKSARIQLYLGKHYNRIGQYEMAIDHLNESLVMLPGNPEAIGEVGYAHLLTGDFVEAERAFLDAVKRDPDDVTTYHRLGRLYMQQGKYREALTQFGRCVELSPLHLNGRVNAGIVHYTQGDFEEAASVFRAVLNLDPTSLASEYFLGLMERDAGDLDAARERFERVVESADPWNVEGHAYLGLIYDQLGMTDKAYAEFVTALGLNPMSAFTHGALARHLLYRGASQQAVESADKALEYNEYAVEVLQVKGMAELQLGHHERAESVLVRARRLRPSDHLTALHLARVYTAQGDWIRADRELRRAWIRRPGEPEVLLARAKLETARGDFPAARELLEQLIELHPDSLAVELEMAHLEIQEGQREAAIRRLGMLSRNEAAPTHHRFRIGMLLEEIGLLEAASRELGIALERKPKNALYLYHGGEVLLRIGRFDEAESLLSRLVDLYSKHGDGKNALAWLHLQREPPRVDDPARALDLVEEAIAVDSTRAYYHDTKAEALLRMGRKEDAGRAWREAARLDPTNEKYVRMVRRFFPARTSGSGGR
jgi:tetratricopeptide (TPR) repeat protein